MRHITLAAPLAIACVLAAGASCDSKSDTAGPAPEFSTVVTPSAAPATNTAPAAATTTQAAPSWPTPEDCTTHNPANVTSFYEAGIYIIRDGGHNLMRLHGGPGETVGQQGLALAKRYKKHCFLGRGNTREEKYNYIFDYWLDPSGMKPSIPGEDEICSTYNKNNLTVENMGSGHGWRVKDHDHVLHLFNNESDARNGKLVLQKYSKICYIGQGYDGDDPNQDIITYFP